MPIDHFSDSSDTFPNRYWLNDTYYQPGGPVFSAISFLKFFSCSSLIVCVIAVFDSGEQNAEPLLPYYLQVRSAPHRLERRNQNDCVFR